MREPQNYKELQHQDHRLRTASRINYCGHKNQINHYDKQRRVLMANSTVCQSKWKPIVEPRLVKPKVIFY